MKAPALTLTALLATAALILTGGVLIARRTERVRVERDREPLRVFADAFQREIARLERLYESHLRRLAREGEPMSAIALRAACANVAGVRQYSLVHRPGAADGDTHLDTGGARPARPTFGAKWNGLPRQELRLSAEETLDSAEESGWIEEPAKPLFYWHRRTSTSAAVLLVDGAAVAAAMDGWLARWLDGPFAAVRAGAGLDRLTSPSRAILASAGAAPTAPAQPDFLLPLRSRFGTWQLASWDRTETRVSYHAPTLAAAGALSVLVALLGVFVAAQQRRALALAAQRVSFVNRVSHELRTPLTNILLNVDLAADALEEAPRDAGRRLGLVQEEARRLGRLIENVLTFSRGEQGRLRIAPRACVPASVIAAAVEQFAPSFARRALAVRCTGDLAEPCLLDADAFAQILANLLSNVEKYVPGGAVEIRGTLAEGTLTITVSDEGPGIPADAVERIFRPFERLDSRVNEGATGAGLGLAIARDLAAGMGGSLRLLPAARGSTFEFRAPAPRVAEPSLLADSLLPAMSA